MYPIRLDADVELSLPDPSCDAGPLFTLIDKDRERLRARLAWVDKTTSVDHQRDYLYRQRDELSRGAAYPFVIRVGGAPAGAVGLHLLRQEGCGEIGYWIGVEYEGRGLVTRAVAAIVTTAFTELDLHRIEVLIASDNERSRAVADRLGFRHEGKSRGVERTTQGRLRDVERYAILAHEWASLRRSTDSRQGLAPFRGQEFTQ